MALKRIQKELADFDMKSPEEWSVKVVDDDSFNWLVKVTGPPGSPYEGGHFWLDVHFPANYPFKPPDLIFSTKIYHCNVTSDGRPSDDIWIPQWSPADTVLKTLHKIIEFMAEPNPVDPMQPSIAQQYKNERGLHDETAREWTRLHAKPEITVVLTIRAVLMDEVLKVMCTNMSGEEVCTFDVDATQMAGLNVKALRSMILQLVQNDAGLELVLPDGTQLTEAEGGEATMLVSCLTRDSSQPESRT